jgi:type II secretory ATPase GspE/PulE/Tfp pilus assembly ATPase PilB-like protein
MKSVTHSPKPIGRPRGLAPRVVFALFALLFLPGLCHAAPQSLPRGPGFYFHPLKFLAIVAVYLGWVRLCWWVDQDARALKQPVHAWNILMLSGGFLGLVCVWLLSFFLLGYLLLLLLGLGPALMYVTRRNELVDPKDRVLTIRHLRELGHRWLSLPKAVEEKGGARPEVIPLRFIGKSADSREEDPNRVKRAQGSSGYQAALELVHEAVRLRATDIHLEPTREEMAVRYRVDGIMMPRPGGAGLDRATGDAVLNIFKVLADLDITEKRKPQDGSFSAEVLGEGDERRTIDFRVATAGSVVGEKMVMRALDHSQRVDSLTQVGMRDRVREQVRGLVRQPHGLFVVCGPTGSGKSTTLYACLNEIDRYQKNVITLENPVEYQIDNVTQIEVNPKAGKTFASELRSILRQDPDVIYVGEIRDQETAEIACQAAQTGHMVFTTLHANDTTGALERLVNLGVQPYTVATAVGAVLGQRLVRCLCPRCKAAYQPNPDLLRKLNLPAEKIKFFYRPSAVSEQGPPHDGEPICRHCGDTGYRGRTGVFELLTLNDRIRDLLREKDFGAIRQEAVKSGMVQLQEDGMRQVIEGETSIQELLRVCK